VPTAHPPSVFGPRAHAYIARGRLSEADKAAILERARTNKLETGKVLERARSGELFDGASATCEEIANIVAVDQKALKQEQELAKVMAKVKKGSQTGALNGMLAGEEARVKAINEKLSKAITNLSSEQAKKCGLL
jgi:transcription antitermination factor NusG